MRIAPACDRLLILLLSTSVAFATLQATPAHAQMSDADREEARGLFAAGQAAVDAGRWTDALDSFQRAYGITHVPSALFNVAFALRALGRFREAESAFVELIALEGTRDDMRTEANTYLEEVRARLGTLRLVGVPDLVDGSGPLVRLDAVPVTDDGSRPLSVFADPGHHALDVSMPGFDRYEWTGDLADGEVRTLAVELFPGSSGAAANSGGIETEAWFWVVVGAVVLGAAGGVVAGVLLDEQAQLQPESMMPIRL